MDRLYAPIVCKENRTDTGLRGRHMNGVREFAPGCGSEFRRCKKDLAGYWKKREGRASVEKISVSSDLCDIPICNRLHEAFGKGDFACKPFNTPGIQIDDELTLLGTSRSLAFNNRNDHVRVYVVAISL